MTIETGRVRFHGVSRSFKVLHERNATLKETLLRRRRTRYTEHWAVRDLDLDVAPGEALGIIGENGAGKSTLLKLAAGIIPPQAGTIETGGKVACMLELGAGFHPDFSGRENIYLNGSIHGLSESDVDARVDEIVEFSELAGFIDMPVRTYSSGMYMRLAFAISSHVDPDVLLLDEVLAVGDEAFQRKCMARIFEFRRGGGTLLFVSHDPFAVERVCDRAILLGGGQVVADGPVVKVLQTYHRRMAEDAPTAEAAEKDADDTGAEEGAQDPRIWGTREVVIESCRILGPNGPTDRLMSGDPMTVELVVATDHEVDTPNVGVTIHSSEGALMYATNTLLDAFPTPRLQGRATVRFSIPAVCLHEGHFLVSLGVASHDDETVFHWLDRWLELAVFQKNTGMGAVDLSGQWALEVDHSASSGTAAKIASRQ